MFITQLCVVSAVELTIVIFEVSAVSFVEVLIGDKYSFSFVSYYSMFIALTGLRRIIQMMRL